MKAALILFLLFATISKGAKVESSDASVRQSSSVPKRCKPVRIRRDARCGCYILVLQKKSNTTFRRRCRDLTRAKLWEMKRSCGVYVIRRRLRPKVFIRNLRYILPTCPGKVDFKSSRNYFRLMKDILLALTATPGPSAPPRTRVILARGESRRVARLIDFNDINIQNGSLFRNIKADQEVEIIKDKTGIRAVVLPSEDRAEKDEKSKEEKQTTSLMGSAAVLREKKNEVIEEGVATSEEQKIGRSEKIHSSDTQPPMKVFDSFINLGENDDSPPKTTEVATKLEEGPIKKTKMDATM